MAAQEPQLFLYRRFYNDVLTCLLHALSQEPHACACVKLSAP